MSILNHKSIFAISKKEFLDNIRNKWSIALILIFLFLIILSSYLAGDQSVGNEIFGGMEDTIVTLLSISNLLIPIIAIILGYSTISGEVENGSLSIVLSYPIKRVELLLCKFIGLGSVLFFSILIGFGVGGIIIAITVNIEEGVGFIMFILLTVILGLIYLSLAIFISSFFKKRATSIVGGVIIFFWGLIYGMIVFGLLLASGVSIDDFVSPGFTLPDWIFTFTFFSPGDMYQVSVLKAFGLSQAFGFSSETPEYMSLGLLFFAQIIWVTIPLILAYNFFNKRDI
jgi:ABC-type transport system involved in multi-copper enzyme maturation permease subunit